MRSTSIHRAHSIFAILIVGLIVGGAYFTNPQFLKAPRTEAAASPLSGYAWSDTVGWISLSGTASNGSPYSVQVDTTTGDFSGDAWSENVGWISFNRTETGNPPGAPYASGGGPVAQVNTTTGAVTGWARALSGVGGSGGWDGWIKLSKNAGDAGAAYGVTIDPATGKFSGYAWGGAQVDASGNSISGGVSVIGWIKFAGDGLSWNGSACTGTNDYAGTNRCNYGVTGPVFTPTTCPPAPFIYSGTCNLSAADLLTCIPGSTGLTGTETGTCSVDAASHDFRTCYTATCPASSCNHNGICEGTETYTTCSSDCPIKTKFQQF